MRQRHCENCKEVIHKNQAYIKVKFKTDSKITTHIVSGLPLHVQGDFCSLGCLTIAVNT